MKPFPSPRVLGLLPLLGLASCGLLSDDGRAELTNASRLNVAMAAEASGDNQMALQMYAAAVAKDPADTNATIHYARALVNARRIGLAREILARQLAARPGQPELSREVATIDVLQGQPAAALPRFDIALAANPSDVRALVNKAIALDMMGNHTDAQAIYRRADTLSPDDPAIRNNLAMSMMLDGRPAEATQVLQTVAEAPVTMPRIRNNMAVLAAANGDMARARELSAGEISDAELRALAAQLRRSDPGAAVPAAPIAAAPDPAPAASAERPARRPARPSAAAATPRPTPAMRVHDKPTAPAARTERLNMTAVEPIVPDLVEQLAEKIANAFATPSATYGTRAGVVPAMATTGLRMRSAALPHTGMPNAGMPSAGEQSGLPVVQPGPRRASGQDAGFAVQLGALDTPRAANTAWRMMLARMPDLMQGHAAGIMRLMRDDGRVFWRLRSFGFSDRDAAEQFCDDVKAQGTDCFVTKS